VLRYVRPAGIAALFVAVRLSGAQLAQKITSPGERNARGEDVAARQAFYRSQRAYPDREIPAAGLREVLRWRAVHNAAMRSSISADVLAAGAQWSALGPWAMLARTNYFQSAPQLDAGRVADVAFDPSNPDVFYAASGGGGVWKTTNGGTTWTPLTDDQCRLSMGAMAVDPKTPSILYASTGELNDLAFGCGVLRSVDGGAHWDLFAASQLAPTAGVIAATGAVYIDPATAGSTTGTFVLVAATNGIYRSTNSGASWTQTFAYWTDHIVGSARDPNVLFAGSSGADLSKRGLLRSVDKGLNWTVLPLPNELTSDRIERVQLATSPAAPDQVWMAVGNFSRTLEGLWRWDDTRSSWTKLGAGGVYNGDPRGDLGKQTDYDLLVTVDPTDANRVYLGGVRLFRSTDGGASFTRIGADVHADWHALRVDPQDPRHLLGGNDGGVFVSSDGGDSWISRSAGMETAMFYAGISIDPVLHSYVAGGTQDNGVVQSDGLPIWTMAWAGDGGYTAFSADGATLWVESQWNGGVFPGPSIGRLAADVQVVNDGIDPSDRAVLEPPLVMHPSVSGTLYFGTQRLYRITDGHLWHQVSSSSDLTKGAGALSYIAIARSDPDTMYIGTTDGLIRMSPDGGVTFQPAGSGLPNRWVTGLAIDPGNAAHVVATVSGFGSSHVWQTTDAGASWSSISGTGGSVLPDLPTNAIAMLPSGTGLAVGTDAGVWLSGDGGTTWQMSNAGLPNVEVNDVVYDPIGQRLVVATFGRGIWTAPVVPQMAVLRGDLNLDGVIDANDAYLVANALVNGAVGNTVQGTPVQILPAGDANCNGQLDTGDALIVLRQAVGLTTSGSCAGLMRSMRQSR
jgi:photosystem II stability/assembly factor-like uncharacterized protein